MPPMAAPGRQEGGWRVTYVALGAVSLHSSPWKWPLCRFVLYFWRIIWIKFPVRNISACLEEETESKLYLMGLRFKFIAWLLKCFGPLNSTKLQRIFTSLQLMCWFGSTVSQQRAEWWRLKVYRSQFADLHLNGQKVHVQQFIFLKLRS